MKPNISELIQMVTYCLQNDLITTGKAMISNTLSEIIASRIDQTSVDSIDLVDVRILAMGLHKVMSRGQRLLVKEKGKDGFQPLRVGTNGATLPAPVVGKHLIVSLGKRGVLWCGPRIAIQPPTERTAHKARQSGENNKDSEHGVTIVLSEDKSFATCHVEALAIDPSRITHTNGAGDALCAGIISEIVVKAKNGVAGNASKIALPDIDCIKKGLANALHRLTSK